MFGNLDKPNDKTPKVWPLGGYAPGGYACKCCHCGMSFSGDKRSTSCVACAVSAILPKPETKPVIQKYRKKPVVVEAIPFRNDNLKDVVNFINKDVDPNASAKGFSFYVNGVWQIDITTLEGVMSAFVGDWIIRGVNGELYPCKDDIFRKTYDLVTDQNAEMKIGRVCTHRDYAGADA